MDFFQSEKDVYGISNLIFEEDVRTNDGRIFRVHTNVLIAVSFHTYSIDPRRKMVKFGLKFDSLANYFILAFEGTDLIQEVNKKSKRIVFERDLITFLNKLHFTFQDGSVLTISKSGAAMEKLLEKW